VFNPQQGDIPTMTRNLEPKKSAEPHRRTQSNAALGGIIREVTGRMRQNGGNAGKRGAHAAVRTSGAIVDAPRIAGEHGWETARRAVGTVAEVQAHFAEASLDQGQRVFDIAGPVADIYREATDRTAGSAQALTHRSKTKPGESFDRADLEAAIAWSVSYPVRLLFLSDHEAFPETIEVSVWGDRGVPRWLVWRDLTGRLVLDARAESENGLLFADLADALGFIAGELAGRLMLPDNPSTPAKAQRRPSGGRAPA
jgi:hypothetical protein